MAYVTFNIGDYSYGAYTEDTIIDTIGVIDIQKTSYEDIPSEVTYSGQTWMVTNINYCFWGCTSLTTAPTIPNGVINMNSCFSRCTSLTTAPTIPSSVTNMLYCFHKCTSLTTAPIIPSSVTDMGYCFYDCTSLTTAPTIPSSVTSMGYCFYNCIKLDGNLKVNNTPTSYADIFTNASTSLDRYRDLFIITEGSASDTTWRSIVNQYDNVHFEADDAIEPTLTINDFYRTNETIAKNATSPVDTKPYYNESGRNGWLKITVKYAPSAILATTTLPSGWKQNLYNINFTADGQTPTSSLIPGGLYPSTFSIQQTTNSIVFAFDDDLQHIVTAQAVVQIKDDDNNVVKTLYSDIKSATLLKIYALMDMYHSDELDEEGLRIGGYAEATGFRISMDTSFQGNGYLVTDATDDAQLISDITALGWDDDVKVQIITSADNYYFGFTQSLTIPFETTPIDYDLDYEITGRYIHVEIDNTQRTITLTATNSEYDQTLTLSFNVGGYIFKKNLTISAQR